MCGIIMLTDQPKINGGQNMTSLAQERKQCSIMQYCFIYIFIVTVCSSTGDSSFGTRLTYLTLCTRALTKLRTKLNTWKNVQNTDKLVIAKRAVICLPHTESYSSEASPQSLIESHTIDESIHTLLLQPNSSSLHVLFAINTSNTF